MKKATQKRPNKALIPSMVQKAEKEKGYFYQLSNGDFLVFQDKIFPTQKNQSPTNQNQLSLFY